MGRMKRIIRRLSCARGTGGFCLPSIDSGLFDCYRDRYDFDLATGKSDTGLRACVYEVRVKQAESDGVPEVWVEAPRGGTGWQLVNLRPVSEGWFGGYSRPWRVPTRPFRFRRPPSESNFQRFRVTPTTAHRRPDPSRAHCP